MGDMHEVNTVVEDIVAEDAQVIYGAVIDENLNEDELTVTVVATGVNQKAPRLAVDNSPATVKLSPVGLDKIIQRIQSVLAHRLQRILISSMCQLS